MTFKEEEIISCKKALDDTYIALVKFYPHRGVVRGNGKTEKLAIEEARKTIKCMKSCQHFFIVKSTSREKKCENCGFIIKEY